ncbi:chloramphenicol efflux transporter CxpE [Acinetobacter sp.]|jgi:predicted PurR-regulated permease PerM|uniref:chloramphenicol efflux transporter CxpE n=1 Tax=Acinetobacter sp. TaxID=472 RepID=UPI00282EEFB2|nr:AI-2E family transporter [Acinetobacter sp.]MDR0237265.1 AI-2E family transporter [Acinetobacter sp.]
MHDRTLKRIFILAAIALVLWILYLLKPVVIPFVAAFLVAYLFSPVVDKLSRLLPRWLSISIVFIGIGVLLTWAIWFVVPLVWKQLIYARDSIPAGIHWVNSTFLPWLSNNFNVEHMELDTDQISKVVMEYVQTNYSADSIQSMALKIAQSGLSFISIGGTIVLIPIIAFYFLLDWNRMLESLKGFIPRQYESSVLNIVAECHSVLGAFVKGQFLVMILLGIVYAVGLQLVGLEVGLIIGMIAGLCSIIPYLGFGVGIIAAIIACFFQFGLDLKHLLMVLAVFGVGQLIEGYILQPFLLGDKIGLSPVAVVFAVLAGAQLGGFVGMLIALPVAAVIVVLLKHLKELYQRSQFYKAESTLVTIQNTGSSETISVESDKVDLDIEVKNTQDTDESIKTDQNPR